MGDYLSPRRQIDASTAVVILSWILFCDGNSRILSLACKATHFNRSIGDSAQGFLRTRPNGEMPRDSIRVLG